MESKLNNSIKFDEIPILATMSLITAWNSEDQYPIEFKSWNNIYIIQNKVNNAMYVGQAARMVDRFIYQGWSHKNTYLDYLASNSTNLLLYNAIRKYSPDNFLVHLLESGVTTPSERESYWIKVLHTCKYDPEYVSGYNMTWGGEDCSQLRTESAQKASHDNNKFNHGGVYSFNTPEVVKAKIAKYGDVMGMCHTQEVLTRSIETRKELYGNPWGAAHTKEARLKKRCTVLLGSISKYINKLDSMGLDRTAHNYYHLTDKLGPHIKLHIIRVLEMLPHLRSRTEWTNEYEVLFNSIKNNYGEKLVSHC